VKKVTISLGVLVDAHPAAVTQDPNFSAKQDPLLVLEKTLTQANISFRLGTLKAGILKHLKTFNDTNTKLVVKYGEPGACGSFNADYRGIVQGERAVVPTSLLDNLPEGVEFTAAPGDPMLVREDKKHDYLKEFSALLNESVEIEVPKITLSDFQKPDGTWHDFPAGHFAALRGWLIVDDLEPAADSPPDIQVPETINI